MQAEDIHIKALELPVEIDEVLLYLTNLLFKCLHLPILSYEM